jgi:hypothetical protein
MDMEHDPRNLGPIRPLRLGVEQAQIRDGVLFVVAGQSGGVRRLVGDSTIKRSLRHWASQLYIPQRCTVGGP